MDCQTVLWGIIAFLTSTLAVYLASTCIVIPLQLFGLNYSWGVTIALAVLSFLLAATLEPVCSK